ncbi:MULTISPECIES: glycoside hydrolase family 43 protein [unclassified Pseudocitrobacter]|uniref:glycoside hydrolase family 43 protein n=1 Tax=unclassified Pseudocitrobacter TaxID=2638778 RepID=UPI0023E3D562|nr:MULTISPECIES: glycoside hydrolase family 43 protein [unclassified Pseudocitrobacter]MDF3830176.1 glycoside hydrolase family 43 protein [Pseudocitrobacter sp. 2023EL-00150]MEC5376334.1 glycoside hydrolase family 43 protein [Pseudocitrobacter sp. MW920760]
MPITNPILKGFHPDPCICRRDDDYYIITSTFEWFPGIRIYHSRDLMSWEFCGYALNDATSLQMFGNPDSGGIWAPDITWHDGRFWIVFTNIKVVNAPWKTGYNYLITAESIEGPWSEPILLGAGGIDPSLYHAQDGKKYLTYRLWGPQHHSNPYNTIVLQEYFHDRQQLASNWKTIFEGTDLKYTEAPHIYYKDGYYYLFTAEGGTRYAHAVTVARAKNIDGPYELHPERYILSAWDIPRFPLQKAGHASLVCYGDNEWYIAYLTARPLKRPEMALLTSEVRGYCPLGRETAIARVEWHDGWPWVADKHPSLTLPPPEGVSDYPTPMAQPIHYDFYAPKLPEELQTLRVPFSEEMGSLTARPGFLRLYGNDSLVSTFLQSTVAMRWKDFHFVAETRITFRPLHYQQSAGLTCYYSTQCWSYCCITMNYSGQRVIKIIQVDKGEAKYLLWEPGIEVPEQVEEIGLRVRVDGLNYIYSYTLDNMEWIDIPLSLESWKLSDDYNIGKGFFTGAFVGLHCEDISHQSCFSDFAYFNYQPLDTPA